VGRGEGNRRADRGQQECRAPVRKKIRESRRRRLGFRQKAQYSSRKSAWFQWTGKLPGPPKKALEAVKKNAKLIRFYPDLIRWVEGRDRQYVVTASKNLTSSWKRFNWAHLHDHWSFPCNFKAIIPVPSFTEYEKAALRVGGDVIFVQLPDNFALEPEKIKNAVTDDTRILCICNPHSPSGTSTTEKRSWTLSDSAARRT